MPDKLQEFIYSNVKHIHSVNIKPSCEKEEFNKKHFYYEVTVHGNVDYTTKKIFSFRVENFENIQPTMAEKLDLHLKLHGEI